MSKKNAAMEAHAGSSVSKDFKEMPSDYSIRLFPQHDHPHLPPSPPALPPIPMPSWEDTFGKLIKYLVTEQIVISLFVERLFLFMFALWLF